MKLASFLKGTSSEDPIELVMPNGDKVPALLRPISDIEDAMAIGYGVSFAEKHGVVGARHGDPLFDKGMRAYTLFVATLDKDSPADKREPFFGSPEDLSKFHPDWVLWLYQRWEILQAKVSPLQRMESLDDLVKGVRELSKDGDSFGFFCGLSPSTRAILARFSASHALNSPDLKSLLSSPSEAPG